jgi:diguanylate cyclase (GGDEF)-like protein
MSPDGTRARALVVDDDATLRLLVSEVLAEQGFVVRQAEDGARALDLLAGEMPDLIVLDLMMPRVDGYQVCAALRRMPRGETVPVLVLTGLDDDEAITRAFEAGATDFATKPISWPMLSHRIRYMVRSKHTLDELRRSQSSLEAAQRISRLGNWDWEVATGRQRWSEETRRILELPADSGEPRFEDFLRRVHPEDAEALSRSIEAALRGEAPFSLDYRVMLRDGSARHVHAQGEVLCNDEGTPIRMSGTIQDITERKEAESRIRFLAFYDSLTGLPNRLLFRELLEKAVGAARRTGRMVAAMCVDLDHFKRINDTSGHSSGDRLLQAVAERLKDTIRASDTITRSQVRDPSQSVARLGGDEFILLLHDIAQADDTAKIACRILDSFRMPFVIGSSEVFISASLGISLFPQDGSDPEELLKNADAALYHAKDSGRNNFQFYSPSLNETAFRVLSLESSLRRAIERHEFVVHYQTQVDARDGRIIGLEALIRWKHPDLGLIQPGQFIPLAEQTGLIQALDEWVLAQTCAQGSRWQAAGLPDLRLSVNLSGHQFRRPELARRIAEVAAAAGVDPRRVELEITESVIMQDAVQATNILNELKSHGFRIAVDDFGTGYSSLSYLRRFRIDSLKIDRSFVRDIISNPDDAAIVSAIVTLARTLKIDVVAEGVENALQREFLRDQGCALMQGYLFSRPLPAEEVERLVLSADAGVAARK